MDIETAFFVNFRIDVAVITSKNYFDPIFILQFFIQIEYEITISNCWMLFSIEVVLKLGPIELELLFVEDKGI